MHCLNRHLAFLLVFILPFISIGQTNDFEIWSGASISKRITDKLSGSFEEQLRMNENVTSVRNFFSEVGLGYRMNDMIKISGYYRYINRSMANGSFLPTSRFHVDLRLRYKAKPVILSYRTRFQTQRKTNNREDESEIFSRNRIAIQLDLDKRFSPYVSTELYYDFKQGELYKVRYTAGVELDLKKRRELDLFYRLQREFNMNNPTYAYVVGIGYSYRLKGKLFKKKSDK